METLFRNPAVDKGRKPFGSKSTPRGADQGQGLGTGGNGTWEEPYMKQHRERTRGEVAASTKTRRRREIQALEGGRRNRKLKWTDERERKNAHEIIEVLLHYTL